MKPELMRPVVALLLMFCVSWSSALNRDVAVLLRVKNSQLDDPDGRLGDWAETAGNAPCYWTGIACDPANRGVVSIDLTGFALSGWFPADFCRIPTVQTLNISDNNFNGSISSESISMCSHLRFMNLSSNLFVGELPEFRTGFVNLTILDLSYNNFTGEIPASFGQNLPALQVLSLAGNLLNGSIPEFLTNLTELTRIELGYNPYKPGPLPSTIGRLTKLQYLWFSNANLMGNIPDSVGNLMALTNFDVSINSLSGHIPDSIGGLKSAVQIELYQNQLSGELPSSLGNLTSLLRFDASQNNLTGNIPERLASLSLESFNLNDNNLDGKIPEALSSSVNLQQLKLFNNNFFGTVPVNLGKNSDLVEFDVSGNKLEGPLPSNLCYRRKLQSLIAFNNKFSGPIPESYGECGSLSYVRIHNNELSGQLPVSFWSLSGLEFIQLDSNRFEGRIPPSISGARGLTELLFYGNNFSGELPSEICDLQELVVMDLSRNRFSGQLPSCITKLKNLQKLDLQENSITSEIPCTLGAWTALTELNLANNEFTGHIPTQLGSLPVLTYLDLSGNSLSGAIPTQLTKLKLNQFNISNNRLDGKVPSGFDREFFVSSLMGNPDLCSPDLKPLPSCRKAKALSLYIVGILSALVLMLVGSLLWILFKTKRLHTFGSKSKPSWKITSFQRVGFKEDDVLFALLNEDNLIGIGGSGKVYRVKLKTGQTVAVKKLFGANLQQETEGVFWSEVGTLGRIKHANIVKLLLACIGEDSRLLVYEYMDNGSLGDMLHEEKGGLMLDWAKRFEIALGAAQGLAYLHHDCVPSIIHRDVKSNNILLDEELRPKVADFGLAKTLQQDVEEGDGVMSRVAGSYGYIAPEYGYTLKVTEKSDVYSFGVILFELVTGKRPNDSSFGENKDIVKWMTEALVSSQDQGSGNTGSCKDMEQLIDPRMNPSTCIYEEIEKVLNVALLCTSAFPMNRPSMRRVVELLKGHSVAKKLND